MTGAPFSAYLYLRSKILQEIADGFPRNDDDCLALAANCELLRLDSTKKGGDLDRDGVSSQLRRRLSSRSFGLHQCGSYCMLPGGSRFGVLSVLALREACMEPVKSSPQGCAQVNDSAESSRGQSIFLWVRLHHAYHRGRNRHASGITVMPSGDGTHRFGLQVAKETIGTARSARAIRLSPCQPAHENRAGGRGTRKPRSCPRPCGDAPEKSYVARGAWPQSA